YAQTSRDVRTVNTKVRGARAIDLHAQLRLIKPQRDIRVVYPADLDRLLAQVFVIFGHFLKARPTNHEIDVLLSVTNIERRRVTHAESERRVLGHAVANFLHDVTLSVIAAKGRERMTSPD